MRRRKRGHKGALIAAAVVAFLLIVCFVLFKVVFVVRNVEYTGNFSMNPDEITRASGIRLGSSVFRVEESAVRDKVNALGTVALEEMQIRYPSTVSLRVRERAEEGMFVFSGGVAVLDEEGCVVRTTVEVPNEDLLYVTGFHVIQCRVGAPIEAQAGQREAYAAVMQALIGNGAEAYASELNLEDAGSLFLLTRGGITVRLGNMENMYNKIAWMKSAVADLETRRQYGGTLDVQSGTKADYTPAATGN